MRETTRPLNAQALGKHLGIPPDHANRVFGALASGKDAGFFTDKKGKLRRVAVRKGPIDAVTFLADRGGIRDDEGHDLTRGRNMQRFVPKGGPLIRPNGMSIDAAGEILHEAGYFGPVETIDRPSESEVLELLEKGVRGKVYTPEEGEQVRAAEEEERAADIETDARADVEAIAKDMGEVLSEADIAAVLEITVAENVDAESAVESYTERLAIQAADAGLEDTQDESYSHANQDIPFETEPGEAPGERGAPVGRPEGEARDAGEGQRERRA